MVLAALSPSVVTCLYALFGNQIPTVCAYGGSNDAPGNFGSRGLFWPGLVSQDQGGTGENTGAQRAGSSLCAGTSLRIGKDLRNLIQMGDVRRLIRAHWFRA